MESRCVFIPIAAYLSDPAYLRSAVTAALNQSWGDVEILVSDDSPDDRLREVVQQCGDSRVRYRHNAARLGVAENYWHCIRECEHDFIAVLNHDDFIAADFLSRLVPPLIADESISVSFCDHWVIDEIGRRLNAESDRLSAVYGRSSLESGLQAETAKLFVNQTIPVVMGSVFRRSAIPFDTPPAGPSYDLWLSYFLCRSGRAYYVNDRLSSWRAHAGNLTSMGGLDWATGSVNCWLSAIRDPVFASVNSEIRTKAAHALSQCATVSRRSGERLRPAKYAIRSFLVRPSLRAVSLVALPAVPVKAMNWLKAVRDQVARKQRVM